MLQTFGSRGDAIILLHHHDVIMYETSGSSGQLGGSFRNGAAISPSYTL